jgi:hypothetical protein
MSWDDRLPEGVGDVDWGDGSFTTSIDIPVDNDGFFGRECPSCERFFKMRVDQWEAIPDDAPITCPYCGEAPEDVSAFLTSDQSARVQAAAEAIAEQWAHKQLADMFRGLEKRRLRPGEAGLEITLNTGSPPPVRSLHDYVEEQVRRTITCDGCGSVYAVYGASAFCPVCGPRPALANVLDAIARQRDALALEDRLPADLRVEAQDKGLFDKATEDAIKEAVTLVEVYARDQFTTRVPGHESVIRRAGGRGVFQRLAGLDDLFAAHASFRLSSLVTPERWKRLGVVFQQRHVLVHRQGIVDQDYVDRVPGSRWKVGQKLVVSPAEAEQALDDVEALVRVIADV